jgi:3-oxoacyl-[acyl-carrier protein] reductase
MNQIDLEGRTAVVTGAAQGIGRAVAERLRSGGARIAIWDRDADLARTAAEELGGHPVAVDQTDADAVVEAAAQTEAELGPIDILVANAGIAGPNAPVVDYDVAAWRDVIEINLNGVFHCCRAVLPGMIDRNYGRVVNVASIAGKEGNPNASAYSASKAGVIALTKSLGKETAAHDIAVNCVTPAAARTRIFEQMSEEHIAYMLSKIPRGRFLDLSGGRATY